MGRPIASVEVPPASEKHRCASGKGHFPSALLPYQRVSRIVLPWRCFDPRGRVPTTSTDGGLDAGLLVLVRSWSGETGARPDRRACAESYRDRAARCEFENGKMGMIEPGTNACGWHSARPATAASDAHPSQDSSGPATPPLPYAGIARDVRRVRVPDVVAGVAATRREQRLALGSRDRHLERAWTGYRRRPW